MRLTLRTLLAYLNDSGMKAREKKEIRARIRKSENTQKLLQHLKAITSDPGLEVLPPNDQSKLGNPNRIAQYIDSSLPVDEVEGFEKEALASAPILSEIANCHSILASLFHNESIKVPLGLRQKIYSLSPVRGDLESLDDGDYADEHPVRVPTIAPELARSESGTATIQKPREKKRKLMARRRAAKQENFECGEPEANGQESSVASRRETRTRWIFAGIAALLLLAVGIGTGWVIGSGGLPFGERELGPISDVDPDRGDSPVKKDKRDPSSEKTDSSKDDDPANGKPDSSKQQDESKSQADRGQDSKPNSGDSAKKGAKDSRADSDKKPTGKSGDSRKPDPARADSDKTDKTAQQAGDAKTDSADNAVQKTDPQVDDRPPVVGKLSKPQQLAIRLNPTSRNWYAIPEDGPIRSRETIRTFHGFPVSIHAENAGTLHVVDKSSFRLVHLDEKRTRLEIDFGKFNIVADEGPLQMSIAGRTLEIEFTRPETQLWIYVRRFSPDRDLADINSRQTLVQLFIARGKAMVVDADVKPELGAGAGFQFVDDQPATHGMLKNRKPVWLNQSPEWYIESSAAEIVNMINSDEPIETQLTELTDDIRFEFVTNATQMLSSLGYYQPLIQLLDNENNRIAWSPTIARFRDDLATNPELVERVTESLSTGSDPEQKALLAMLVGTNDEQLENGMDKILVEQLKSKSLARRVLAIENLGEITGRTYLFRPDSAERFRRPKIGQWSRDQAQGKIRFTQKFELPQFEFHIRPEKPESSEKQGKKSDPGKPVPSSTEKKLKKIKQ